MKLVSFRSRSSFGSRAANVDELRERDTRAANSGSLAYDGEVRRASEPHAFRKLPAKEPPMPRPIALTIAGSDSSGGAGIQADLKTFSALGVYGASVLTALTAQNTTGVQGVYAVPPAFVAAQMASVLDDLDVRGIKTGMLADAPIIRAVAAGLAERAPAVPLIVDPVMIATSGDLLLERDAIDTLKTVLIPLATLITPNLPEAAALLGEQPAETEPQALDQLGRLVKLGARAVLLKGGHGSGSEVVDLLAIGSSVIRLAAPRIATRHTHGTGCTLSAAIAARMAAGDDLEAAVRRAKAYVHAAIAAGVSLGVGRGNGPVDHLFGQPGGREA
jgi:hydroxymethylpyrimidine/phosphomethylpyrimidine kinase